MDNTSITPEEKRELSEILCCFQKANTPSIIASKVLKGVVAVAGTALSIAGTVVLGNIAQTNIKENGKTQRTSIMEDGKTQRSKNLNETTQALFRIAIDVFNPFKRRF